MKKILLLPLTIFCLACSPNEKTVTNQTTLSSSPEEVLGNCFPQPQLITPQGKKEMIGCFNHFYKRIDDKQILKISFKKVELNGCEWELQDEQYSAEIWIFEDGQAHTKNLCTCLPDLSLPEPLEVVTATSGTIHLATEVSENSFGGKLPLTSIFVESLVFHKSLFETIEITDEIFWQVFQANPG